KNLQNSTCTLTTENNSQTINCKWNETCESDILKPENVQCRTEDGSEKQSKELRCKLIEFDAFSGNFNNMNDESDCDKINKNDQFLLKSVSHACEWGSTIHSQSMDLQYKETKGEEKRQAINLNTPDSQRTMNESVQDNKTKLSKECDESLKNDLFDKSSGAGPASSSSPSQGETPGHSNIFPDMEQLLSDNFTAYMTSSGNEHQDHQFHLWSSDIAFHSRPNNNLDDANIDFDSVLSAPNLEEALRKLEQGLQTTNSNESCNKSSDFNESREKSEIEGDLSSLSNAIHSNESSPICEDILDINIHGEEELAEEPAEVENVSYDVGDSDYISLDDLQSSFKQSPENRNNDETRQDNYKSNYCFDDLARHVEFESSTTEKDKQQYSNELMGPAEKEIWGISDFDNNSSSDEIKNLLTGLEFAANLGNFRSHSRVLTPGAPLMSSVPEEHEENGSNIPRYLNEKSESYLQTENNSLAVLSPIETPNNVGEGGKNTNSESVKQNQEISDDIETFQGPQRENENNTNYDYLFPLNIESLCSGETNHEELSCKIENPADGIKREDKMCIKVEPNIVSEKQFRETQVKNINIRINFKTKEDDVESNFKDVEIYKENENIIKQKECAEDVENKESEFCIYNPYHKYEHKADENSVDVANKVAEFESMCKNQSDFPITSPISEHILNDTDKTTQNNVSNTSQIFCDSNNSIFNINGTSNISSENGVLNHLDQTVNLINLQESKIKTDLMNKENKTDTENKYEEDSECFIRNSLQSDVHNGMSNEKINSNSSRIVSQNYYEENNNSENSISEESKNTDENTQQSPKNEIALKQDFFASIEVEVIASDKLSVPNETPKLSQAELNDENDLTSPIKFLINQENASCDAYLTNTTNDNVFSDKCSTIEDTESSNIDSHCASNYTEQLSCTDETEEFETLVPNEITSEILLTESSCNNKLANEVDEMFNEIYDSIINDSKETSISNSKDDIVCDDTLIDNNEEIEVSELQNTEFYATQTKREQYLHTSSNKTVNVSSGLIETNLTSNPNNEFPDEYKTSTHDCSFEINHLPKNSSLDYPFETDDMPKNSALDNSFETKDMVKSSALDHSIETNDLYKPSCTIDPEYNSLNNSKIMESPCHSKTKEINNLALENCFSKKDETCKHEGEIATEKCKEKISHYFEGFPTTMRVNQRKDYWDQKLKRIHDEDKCTVNGVQNINKRTMSYSEVYLKVCSKYSEHSLINRDKPSIRVPGIVNKYRNAFEKQDFAFEDKTEVNDNLCLKDNRNSLDTFEDNSRIGNLDNEGLNFETQCPGFVEGGKLGCENKFKNIHPHSFLDDSIQNKNSDTRINESDAMQQNSLELIHNGETQHFTSIHSKDLIEANLKSQILSSACNTESASVDTAHSKTYESSEENCGHNNQISKNDFRKDCILTDQVEPHENLYSGINEIYRDGYEAEDEMYRARLIQITEEGYRTPTPNTFLQYTRQNHAYNNTDSKTSSHCSLESQYKFDTIDQEKHEIATTIEADMSEIKHGFAEMKPVNSEECKSRFLRAKKFFEILEKKDCISPTNRRRHRVLESTWKISKSLDLDSEESGFIRKNEENWGSAPGLQRIQQEIECNKISVIKPKKKKRCIRCGKLKRNKIKLNETTSAPTSDTETHSRKYKLKNSDKDQFGGSERIPKMNGYERFHVKNLFSNNISGNKSTYVCNF
ncbi:hypothetical protein L9F63_010028, partial [Diploptera punctata]